MLVSEEHSLALQFRLRCESLLRPPLQTAAPPPRGGRANRGHSAGSLKIEDEDIPENRINTGIRLPRSSVRRASLLVKSWRLHSKASEEDEHRRPTADALDAWLPLSVFRKRLRKNASAKTRGLGVARCRPTAQTAATPSLALHRQWLCQQRVEPPITPQEFRSAPQRFAIRVSAAARFFCLGPRGGAVFVGVDACPLDWTFLLPCRPAAEKGEANSPNREAVSEFLTTRRRAREKAALGLGGRSPASGSPFDVRRVAGSPVSPDPFKFRSSAGLGASPAPRIGNLMRSRRVAALPRRV